MKKYIILFIFLSIGIAGSGQKVSCEELMSYVKENGSYKASVFQIQLINSSWLKEVKAYSINKTIVVIAEIKRDDYGLITKKYVFCGIPSSNWDSFYYGLSDLNKTYGERFQKYIMDYKCNCE